MTTGAYTIHAFHKEAQDVDDSQLNALYLSFHILLAYLDVRDMTARLSLPRNERVLQKYFFKSTSLAVRVRRVYLKIRRIP